MKNYLQFKFWSTAHTWRKRPLVPILPLETSKEFLWNCSLDTGIPAGKNVAASGDLRPDRFWKPVRSEQTQVQKPAEAG